MKLFQQRQREDKSLLRTAEVCSLVYSFDSQTTEGNINELTLLGSLYEMSARKLYENISELKRRDLVQQRGIWRAVLPHAVANRLAKRALENIPLDAICSVFENSGLERLLKSFSRRLSYLHECNVAVEISRRWLCEDGLLGDVINLNELGASMFQNIAPVNPELTLTAIERALNHKEADKFFSRNNSNYLVFTRLLRSLAYDKDLFIRSVELLCRFALSEKPNENYNSIIKLLKSLFYIHFSGTHATIEQRIYIISNLINSNNNENINLSISLLSASLEAYEFTRNYEFEFGSRSRDYGYTPRNRVDVQCWFKTFIEYSVTLINSNEHVAPKIKSLLAEKFCGLWTEFEMYDELETAARQIKSKCSWNEGWIAVKHTKRFNGKDIKAESISRLNYLDKLLKPTTLMEKAKLYIFSGYGSNNLDLVDTIETEEDCDEYLMIEDITRSLGHDISKDKEILKQLIADILSKEGPRVFCFGQGLANGTEDPEKMWQDFCIQLAYLEKSKRKYQMICGFLNRISELDENLSEKFLKDAVTDKILTSVYPLLQASVKITKMGVDRLKRSVEIGGAPIDLYSDLAYGRRHESISDDDLCELLRLIATKVGGLEVTFKILQMRFHGFSTEKTFSDNIISLGQELVLNYFSKEVHKNANLDYRLGKIINVCFRGESAEEYIRILCRRISEANSVNNIYFVHYMEVMKTIALNQSKVFLDIFLEENTKNCHLINPIYQRNSIKQVNFNFYMDNDVIINWCEVNPETRYPILSLSIIPYRIREQKDRLEWMPLAKLIINNSPNPIEVLNKFKSSFRPDSWSGSLAEAMQSRLCLILELKCHENSLIREWAFNTEKAFNEEIRSAREWELKIENERNECFE